MSKFIGALLRALFVLFLVGLPVASFAAFSISNGQLVDGNGTPFVMRGVAYPYTWYSWRGEATVQQDIANIAATKANTVRYVLSTGGQWARIPGAQVTQVIEWAKANKMISVLEVHDSTGWSEGSGSVPISNAVSYWTSSDIRAAINGQEDYAIINIANEPFGNNTTANYVADTIAAIQALRSAGITHTLMIDAANWGQDWSNTMRTNALQIWNADPQRNLVFSVHMYEVYAQASTITSYMQAFDDMGLPLVIGEFGLEHNGQNVDEATIMAQAQARGNGYIAWSWSGNGSCCAFLDMVTDFGTTLTAWGQIVVNGANGIAATSVPASVFGATNTLNVSSTAVSLAAAASSAPVSVTANVSWAISDNQSWLTVSPTSGSNNGSFTVSASANTGSAARTGTVTITGGGLTRSISVTQAAPVSNNLTLSAAALSLAAAAASSAVSVTANVSWSVTDNQSWLSVSPASGSNNGSFTVSASANSASASRSGTVTVTGGGITRTIAVTQAGQSSTNNLAVSTSTLSLAAAAASSTISVTANVSWTVSDDQSWLSASPASGSNNGSFTVSTTANTASASRSGTVTVTGGGITRSISVTQAGQGGTGGCSNPITFSGNTGNFNTAGGACYRTNANVNGWGCYNFDGRSVSVGGVLRSCGQLPLTRNADGYFYFEVTAGQFPWAGLYTW